MRVAVVKATKQTFWSLMESSDSSFNPFDVSLPYNLFSFEVLKFHEFCGC